MTETSAETRPSQGLWKETMTIPQRVNTHRHLGKVAFLDATDRTLLAWREIGDRADGIRRVPRFMVIVAK